MSVGSAVSLAFTGKTSWNALEAGSWAQNANWSAGVPDSALAVVVFSSSITAPATVTLDGNKTVNGISFSSTKDYTIAQGTGGVLSIAGTIESNGGNHSITAPVTIEASSIVATVDSGRSFTLSGPVTGVGGLIKGGPGRLVLSGANTFAGVTVVADGIVDLIRQARMPSAEMSVSAEERCVCCRTIKSMTRAVLV